MAIEVPCPCGKHLRAPDDAGGKRVKCPSCGRMLNIPEASTPEADVAWAEPVAAVASRSNSAQPTTRRGGLSPNSNRRCHEVDYEIIGDDMQLVIVELDPGETIVAEAGAMLYIEEGIQFEAKMGDGSQPDEGMFGKMMSMGKRMLTGESLFMTHFTHHGHGKSHVAFAAPYPGKIIPVDMSTIPGNDLEVALQARLRNGLHLFDATELARVLLGDSIFSNMMVFGAAWQMGLVPLSHEAISDAIGMNGAAVEANRQAFEMGRWAVENPDEVAGLTNPNVIALPKTLEEQIAYREGHLTAYGGKALAKRYRALVEKVEDPRLKEAVAKGFSALR